MSAALSEELRASQTREWSPAIEVEGKRNLHPILRDQINRFAARRRFGIPAASTGRPDRRGDPVPRESRMTVKDDGKGIDPRFLPNPDILRLTRRSLSRMYDKAVSTRLMSKLVDL
jgi:hypothetical protein